MVSMFRRFWLHFCVIDPSYHNIHVFNQGASWRKPDQIQANISPTSSRTRVHQYFLWESVFICQQSEGWWSTDGSSCPSHKRVYSLTYRESLYTWLFHATHHAQHYIHCVRLLSKLESVWCAGFWRVAWNCKRSYSLACVTIWVTYLVSCEGLLIVWSQGMCWTDTRVAFGYISC